MTLSMRSLATGGFVGSLLGCYLPILSAAPIYALGFSSLLLGLDAWLSRERGALDALSLETKAREAFEVETRAELVRLSGETKRLGNSVAGRAKG